MEAVCGGPKPYLNADQLELEHLRCKEKAMEQFRVKRKMGGAEFSESYRNQLELVSMDKLCRTTVALYGVSIFSDV